MSERNDETHAAVLSLGQCLIAAREREGLTREAVESVLHISSQLIIDIEHDEIDQAVNSLFTKGYIKSYAALVKLDIDEMLALYASQYSDDAVPKKMQTFSNRVKLTEHNNYLNYVSWLIVLLLAGTTFGWWYQQANTVAVLDTVDTPVNETRKIQDDAQLANAIPVSIVAPQLIDATFSFSQDCWIKVTDATKETIAIGIKKQGATLALTGVPPFEVNLGAAQAVTITYLGQQLDFTPYINGKTARFNVPLDK